MYTLDRDFEDLTNRVDSDDTVAKGEDSGSFTASEDAIDDFVISADVDGFASFDWDSADVSVVILGNEEADIINNFQTGGWVNTGDGEDYVGDSIGLEGDLLASTVEGVVEGFSSANAIVQPFSEQVTRSFVGTAPYSRYPGVNFDMHLTDPNSPFTLKGGFLEIAVYGYKCQ